MASVGRNDPCPCGSGKKYKRCCANVVPSREADGRDRIHAIDRVLFERMMQFAAPQMGRGFHPFEDFPGGFLDEDFDNGMMQLIGPWSVYENRLLDHRGKEATIAERFRLANEGSLSSTERTWLEAQARSSLSIWEAERVDRGIGIQVHDLLTGEKCFVSEVMMSRTLMPSHGMLARVVDSPSGGAVFCGAHPSSLPPQATADAVASIRKDLRKKRGPIPRERLRDLQISDELISLWGELVQREHSRPIPTLQNTDGDELLVTVDRFAVKSAMRDEVVRRLSALDGALVAALRGDEQPIMFERKGPGQETTIVGVASVSEKLLKLETNSIKRADALRARVVAACGDLVRHTLRDHSDPQVMLKSMKPSTSLPSSPLPTAETMAMIREVKAKHYATWMDIPVPALKGKTPREAARRKRDREALEALIAQMAASESLQPEAERYDFNVLRAALGL